MKYRYLSELTRLTLIEWLPPAIKASIEEFLARGASREEIWLSYQDAMRRQGVEEYQPTYLAIHACLWPDRDLVPSYRDTLPDRSQ